MYIIRNKVLITAILALIGSALAILGGSIRNPITIMGLILVILAPIISYIIVYFWYSRE